MTTQIYTLSLHDALPICRGDVSGWSGRRRRRSRPRAGAVPARGRARSASWDCACARPASSASSTRSEEHTSELQSRQYLVCRLLLEKKKNTTKDRENTVG